MPYRTTKKIIKTTALAWKQWSTSPKTMSTTSPALRTPCLIIPDFCRETENHSRET
ncbi:unnamed protein product [Pylaiella littoralis]